MSFNDWDDNDNDDDGDEDDVEDDVVPGLCVCDSE